MKCEAGLTFNPATEKSKLEFQYLKNKLLSAEMTSAC